MADSCPSDEEEYVDALGVITALERTCELESKLRQCIQDTHPLTTTLDWDFNAADREREGLLAIRCAEGAGCARWAPLGRRWRRRQPAAFPYASAMVSTVTSRPPSVRTTAATDSTRCCPLASCSVCFCAAASSWSIWRTS